MVSILLKVCERSNKIITKKSHEAISVIVKAHLNLITSNIPLIIDFGQDSCNRFARQICIDIIKELFESINDSKILNNIMNIADSYIRLSSTDSCDVVRATARKIIYHLKKYENSPFSQSLTIENSQSNSSGKIVSALTPNAKSKSSDRKATSISVQKPKALGKAQRVKIVP